MFIVPLDEVMIANWWVLRLANPGRIGLKQSKVQTGSNLGDDLMRTRIFRALGWILIAAILALSLVPPSLRPITGLPHNLEHFAIFALCGYAFGLGYRFHRLQAIGLVAFSGLVEMLQLMTAGRHARLTDLIVDALASCAGVLLGWMTLKLTLSEGASANWRFPDLH